MTAQRIASLLLTFGALACASSVSPYADELPRARPGVLYVIGANLGNEVSMYDLDEDEAREVARGMIDSARGKSDAGASAPATADQLAEFNAVRLRAMAWREELAGRPILEAAAREPGALEFESGMVLRVIERGSGTSPTIWDFVTVNYHGTLRDGTVFESNRGEVPLRVRLGATTRCWQQALTAVAAGARLHVVCPPALGWGAGGGIGTPVPGGAVISYDLELLSVEPMPEPQF